MNFKSFFSIAGLALLGGFLLVVTSCSKEELSTTDTVYSDFETLLLL